MKQIELKISSTQDNESVSGSVLIQRDRRGTWINEQEITVLSEEKKPRTFVLDDEQRLVITATSNVKTVYDKNQMAAVPVTVPHGKKSSEDTDGDEESPPGDPVERASYGSEAERLKAQEARDKAITEAREKLKAQQATTPPEAPAAAPQTGPVKRS